MRLLYGTGNPAKLEFMRHALEELGGEGRGGCPLELLGLADMDREAPAIGEDGRDPLENARQKALAYYGFYKVPVFSCDSGLYFEGLPGELQPGVHVRRVKGASLSDEEMRAYYGGLAERYGNLTARYQNAICLVLDGGRVYECMDKSLASEPFLIVPVPHSPIRRRGFPLDSLSVDIRTGKYFYELEGGTDRLAVEKGCQDFFRRLVLAGVL